MKFKLPNGIELDDSPSVCETLALRAKQNGLDVRIFLATHKDGFREYIIVEGTTVTYASPRTEDVWARLDIMRLARCPATEPTFSSAFGHSRPKN